MRYATWYVYFTPDAPQGTTPEFIIRERGGQASGALNLPNYEFVGYLSDNADISGLDNWQVKEITQNEALSYFPPNTTVNADGTFFVPIAPPPRIIQ